MQFPQNNGFYNFRLAPKMIHENLNKNIPMNI